MSFISYIYIVSDKPLMHDNSSSEENFFPTKLILQTSILQENCVDDEHVKPLSMQHIGMFFS
jgi:hypothetical protein